MVYRLDSQADILLKRCTCIVYTSRQAEAGKLGGGQLEEDAIRPVYAQRKPVRTVHGVPSRCSVLAANANSDVLCGG